VKPAIGRMSAQIVSLVAKVWNSVEPMPIVTTHHARTSAKAPASCRRTCQTPIIPRP